MGRVTRSRFRCIHSLLVLLVLLAIPLSACIPTTGSQPGKTASTKALQLFMLDVGQADSILVSTPSGRSMLVDAGNDRSDFERVILPHLRNQGISTLDYLVLSHPDQDHVGGMPALLESVPVGAFLDSVQPGATNRSYLETLQQVQSKGVKAIKARRGRADIELGTSIETQILGPEEPLLTTGDSPTNNNSVVLRVTYGKVSILLGADMGPEAEERLLAHKDNLRSQILKVAHHGSQYSSTPGFLEAVEPEVGLISAGAGNRYQHPHAQLLQRLDRRHVRIYRTDRNGSVQVVIDGNGYQVIPQKQGA